MVIKVHCPQGHTISCKDELAGQTGKCPKCGAVVKVPGQAAEAPPDDDNIVFLCPNGHKLNGPASLQGRPGQCPHCQARFVIPDYSEPDDDAEATVVSKAPWTPADSPELLETLEPIESLEEPLPAPPSQASYASMEVTSYDQGAPAELEIQSHPTAAMLRRLWQERQDGAVIELQLKDGSLLTPDRFAESSCDQDLGIFASKDSEGGYLLSAVAWDSIARISVRRLKRLPRDFFT